MTRPRTIYIAPHRTYILDVDGSLMAIAAPGPVQTPMTCSRHSLGELHRIYPNVALLCGDWLEFLCQLMGAAHAIGRPLLWPGDDLRLRSRTFDAVVRL
jgi:hypothetical protein